jgi:hypothetical protein
VVEHPLEHRDSVLQHEDKLYMFVNNNAQVIFEIRGLHFASLLDLLLHHGNVDACTYVTSAAFAQVCSGTAQALVRSTHPIGVEITTFSEGPEWGLPSRGQGSEFCHLPRQLIWSVVRRDVGCLRSVY